TMATLPFRECMCALTIIHFMREVAILGAGELGGATAHVLARRDVVRSIRLIDEAGSIAAGKALDIAQAAPIENFSTQMSGTSDIASAAGAAVIVLADRSGTGEWNGDEGARLLKRLSTMAPRAVMLCARAGEDRSRLSRAACGSNAGVRIGFRSAGVGRARAVRARRQRIAARCRAVAGRAPAAPDRPALG